MTQKKNPSVARGELQATIGSHIHRAFVVALNEDVEGLTRVLRSEGLEPVVARGPSPQERAHWSRAFKCLASHVDVWHRIAESGEFSMVCEADFVPVIGLRRLPLPCPPPAAGDTARIAWLYSPGSTLYGVDGHGFTYGHANSAVAYIMTPECASRAIGFFEEEIEQLQGGEYAVWDSRLGVYLRWKQGVKNYFVFCQYGEHGGVQNPEHSRHGFRGWHQAYRIAGRPAFLPGYALGSKTRYAGFRLRAWARGVLRIVTLRMFDPRFIDKDQQRLHLAVVTLSALLAPRYSEGRRLSRAQDAASQNGQEAPVS